MTETILKALPGLKLTKVLQGQTGRYYKIADGAGRELYTKLKIEHSDQFLDGKFIKVDTLQVNFMTTGEAFDLPAGFEFVEERPYVYNGEQVMGAVIGKAWVPMGQFSKSLLDVHNYIHDEVADLLDASIAPLLASSGMAQALTFKGLLKVMIETIQEDGLKVPPVVYLAPAWEAAKKDVYDKAHEMHKQQLMLANGVSDAVIKETDDGVSTAITQVPTTNLGVEKAFPAEPPQDLQDDDGNPND